MLPELPRTPAHEAARHALHNLLNCYLREVAGPAGQTSVHHRSTVHQGPGEAHLEAQLPDAGAEIRVPLEHASLTGNHRYGMPAQFRQPGGTWQSLDWETFAQLVTADLAARTGTPNDELLSQIRQSVEMTEAALSHAGAPTSGDTPLDAYLRSEQALKVGHRFHPAPKSRSWGDATEAWSAYAPELGARFALHYFAVRRDLIMQDSMLAQSTAALVRPAQTLSLQDDFVLVPTHPGQARLLREWPQVRAALSRGELQDLGPLGPEFSPTASVRTLMHPDVPFFYKCSLNVRITNCVRKNAEYELEGAVHLSRVWQQAEPEFTARFPHTRVLLEPAFLSVRLGDTAAQQRETIEGFGLILREQFTAYLQPGVTPLLSGALFGNPSSGLPGQLEQAALLTGLPPRETALEWFAAYLDLLVPPVLHALFAHGVVFEPHLQNVVVGLRNGWPTQVFLRDLEGTKLIAGRAPQAWFEGASDRARQAFTYSAERGWQRVAYCLLVNHLTEVVAELAAFAPESELWPVLAASLRRYQRQHGTPASARQIHGLLSGAPWPVKTNLLTRFARQADREAQYVPLRSPLAHLVPA
ncbi:IucA/IucC family protein [Deinococcus deserti]|uniref:Putative siderophore biosynthesis protein n=1 Tax=Deinococcus deserti (strain DSM 17065 / CIP 109153 / LMG 22923 / VCD115) TaxID=546414 RepID=C1CZH0_DEIDV|nr:IucA/IucC family protein [Deinococcus deserti]ACO47218.1 putative siderophore biosynthesis protein [Deinococcus deserti VCD115]